MTSGSLPSTSSVRVSACWKSGRKILPLVPRMRDVYKRQDYAHCHTLRDVVQRYRQNHHGGALELAFWPFGLQAVLVQMRDEMVQQQQKQNAQPETHRRREKCQPAQICSLLHSRDQQAPYRCRHHHSGGKTGEGCLLYTSFQEYLVSVFLFPHCKRSISKIYRS